MSTRLGYFDGVDCQPNLNEDKTIITVTYMFSIKVLVQDDREAQNDELKSKYMQSSLVFASCFYSKYYNYISLCFLCRYNYNITNTQIYPLLLWVCKLSEHASAALKQ